MMSYLIARHEWRRLFASPLNWLSMGLLQLVCAVVFVILLGEFANTGQNGAQQGVALFIGGGLFGFGSFIFLLLIPLISMRSVAEERNQGSLDLLLSSPVSSSQIILGKYFALVGYCWLLLLPLFLMPASLAWGSSLDWGILLSNSLGLALLTAAFAAICLFMSSIAAQPIIAALANFGILLLLWLSQAAAAGHGALMAVLEKLSPLLRLDAMRRGVLDSQDLGYFLILAALFVGLSILALQWPRAKSQRRQLLISSFLCSYILLLVGLISHWQHKQLDLSYAGHNSLQTASHELLKNMPDAIEATAWIQPELELRQQIRARFAAYLAAKKNFSLDFVDPASDPERVRQLGLSGVGEVIIEYQGRHETLDTLSEPDISNALQRLSHTQSAKVVFLSGHAERQLNDTGPAGYSKLAEVLNNKGLTLTAQSLALEELPDDTALLVVAAPQDQALDIELQRIERYLRNGGSILLLFDPDTQKPQRLLAALGLQAMTGAQVFPDYQSLGATHPALAVQTQYPGNPITVQLEQMTAFPVAGGLKPIEPQGWTQQTLLQSSPRSWLETSDLEQEIRFDQDSDLAGPILYGVSAERGLQRAVVIADSDFMANSYLPQLGNRAFSLAILQWLLNRGDTLSIDLPNAPDAQLQLSPRQSQLLTVAYVIVLPLLLLSIAVYQFVRRRQR